MAYYASATSDSDHKNLMIGLNLMYLVASNRLSEFHMVSSDPFCFVFTKILNNIISTLLWSR